ncbi:MAG: methionyl-tRNA formyltransferase [Lachnospiraceae bacterium]|nr:methionyl-tRNA formyltransferase [Lachnospiraceae bacterium]
MKIVFMGTPDFALVSLEALYEAGHEITAVVTQPDRPKGRKKEPVFSPVKEYALSKGLTLLQPERIRDEEWIERLSDVGADLFVVAAFGQILPKKILDMPRFGCINLHASLLPEYRGAAPIQQAILDGKKVTGVTIQQMSEKLDAGDIIAMKETPIGEEETGGELFDRLSVLGAGLLTETIPLIESGNIDPRPQDESRSTYVKMLKKEDGHLDFNLSAPELYNRIRGLDPWPGAYVSAGSSKLKIWKSRALASENRTETPGTVIAAAKDGIDVVCAGGGILRITQLQAEGKKRMAAADYLRGNAIENGTVFS